MLAVDLAKLLPALRAASPLVDPFSDISMTRPTEAKLVPGRTPPLHQQLAEAGDRQNALAARIQQALEDRTTDLEPVDANGKTFYPPKGSLAHRLSIYDGSFPAEIRATIRVWTLDADQLPEAISSLSTNARDTLVAVYAKQIYLSIIKYPDLLDQGLIYKDLHDRRYWEHLESYRQKHGMKGVTILRGDLLKYNFGYDEVDQRVDPNSLVGFDSIQERIQDWKREGEKGPLGDYFAEERALYLEFRRQKEIHGSGVMQALGFPAEHWPIDPPERVA